MPNDRRWTMRDIPPYPPTEVREGETLEDFAARMSTRGRNGAERFCSLLAEDAPSVILAQEAALYVRRFRSWEWAMEELGVFPRQPVPTPQLVLLQAETYNDTREQLDMLRKKAARYDEFASQKVCVAEDGDLVVADCLRRLTQADMEGTPFEKRLEGPWTDFPTVDEILNWDDEQAPAAPNDNGQG